MINETLVQTPAERTGFEDLTLVIRKAKTICEKAKNIIINIGAVHHIEQVEHYYEMEFTTICSLLSIIAWLKRRSVDDNEIRKLFSHFLRNKLPELIELSNCVYGRIPDERYSILCVLARISLMLSELS